MPKLKSTTPKFVPYDAACEMFGCSEQHLRNLQSHLKYGVHYIDLRLPNSTKAVYRYDLEKLAEWFNLEPGIR